MFNYLIILTAVINLINSQEPPEVDDVAVLSGLASSTLDCSLKFDRDFIASNADIAAAIEDMLENRPTRQPGATKEPCEDGEDSRPRRGGRGGKGRRDTTTVAPESETVPEFRRSLRGKGKGRGVTREPLADGETREPKPTREPCTGDDCGRRGKGKGRGVTREPLADGETREPKQTREPCTGDNCQRRGRGKGRRGRDVDSSESNDDEATEAPLLRRDLGGKGKGRGVTREPLADGETREPKPTREPCTGDNCERRGRGKGRRGRDVDSSESSDDEATTAAPLLRRDLGGKGKGRGVTREPLADGETREPKPTREPCTGDDCERRGKGKGRGVTREPLADGETREPKPTREPCTGDDCERRGGRGKGKGRGRRSREGTKEPCEDGEDCRRRRHDSESSDDEEATTAAPLLRRALGRERARGVTREPLADGETREPRQIREPKDGREQPCEGEDCRRRRRREADSTNKPREDAQQRLLRGERNAELDGAARDPRQTREQGDRKQRRRRKADDTEESTTEPLLRRSLGRGGRRGRRGIEATISDGSVEVAGLVGEVIFGEVDEDLESVPLSLTLGGVTFSCDVEVRRRGVSCRAISEEDFKVRIGCAIETPEL